MYIEAELVTKAYLPDELEIGMLFIRINFPGTDDSQIELFALDKIPRDKDVFLRDNGAPVELFVILTDDRESFMEIIATPNQMAWIDIGDENLYVPELSFYNMVLNEYHGVLEVEIDEDEEEDILPMLVEGKAIIRELTEEITCDNCGYAPLTSNASGDLWCESCGWEENEEEL